MKDMAILCQGKESSAQIHFTFPFANFQTIGFCNIGPCYSLWKVIHSNRIVYSETKFSLYLNNGLY